MYVYYICTYPYIHLNTHVHTPANGAAIAAVMAAAAVAVVDSPPMRCVSHRYHIYTACVRKLLVRVAAVYKCKCKCTYEYKYKFRSKYKYRYGVNVNENENINMNMIIGLNINININICVHSAVSRITT